METMRITESKWIKSEHKEGLYVFSNEYVEDILCEYEYPKRIGGELKNWK